MAGVTFQRHLSDILLCIQTGQWGTKARETLACTLFSYCVGSLCTWLTWNYNSYLLACQSPWAVGEQTCLSLSRLQNIEGLRIFSWKNGRSPSFIISRLLFLSVVILSLFLHKRTRCYIVCCVVTRQLHFVRWLSLCDETSPVRSYSRLHGFMQWSLFVCKHFRKKQSMQCNMLMDKLQQWHWKISVYLCCLTERFRVKRRDVGLMNRDFVCSPSRSIFSSALPYATALRIVLVSVLMSRFALNAWWWITRVMNPIRFVTSEALSCSDLHMLVFMRTPDPFDCITAVPC